MADIAYRQVKQTYSNDINPDVIERTDTHQVIPADMRNQDYRNFLAWQAAGGQIEPPEDMEEGE